MVGVRGLEPPTSASRTLRASRLRYTPKNDPRKEVAGPIQYIFCARRFA
jgi:hypothetical protein